MMLHRTGGYAVLTAWAVMVASLMPAASSAEVSPVPENVYTTPLAAYPGPWGFLIGKQGIILVSDDELVAMADPDKTVDLRVTFQPQEDTLRRICERAQAAGQRTIILSFDHFFAQYRPGQAGKPRKLTPDTQEYIDRIAAISKFAQQYGLGLELSLLTPLEIGPGYEAETGESGVWMHYREGLRDPQTGAYSVQLWRQKRWANNKGPLMLEDAGVRVFAFREEPVHGSPYRAVDPNQIVEITETAQVEAWDGATRRAGDFEAVRVRVHGAGREDLKGLDRVLVVQSYKTPEMDYFSPRALPYLTKLADRYADAGVRFNGLYSDEMHIQQDWAYFGHHDHGEFALRYISPGLAQTFAQRFGAEYQDFAKYLIYFTCGQEDFAGDLTAKEDTMHVFGGSPEAIQATALFRARYYHLLQDGVTDLFVAAKRHLETRMGYRLESRAHATWAESPTIDRWNTGEEPHQRSQYEYTSNFVWSDTVHQAASACADYFKWGDFLTGNGNDHAEGGWIDRDYFALALACSTGILNEVPYSYAAHWGMPDEISRRRTALVNTYGTAAAPYYGMVQGMVHRDTPVLMLYPSDLVAAQERFGSWMTQYGYANYITQAKLLERAQIDGGALRIAGRSFTTLATLFEPFPSPELLDLMRRFTEAGGRVIWSGPPPVVLSDGTPAAEAWSALTGVSYAPNHNNGLIAPGKQIAFEGFLQGLPPMTILTDFIVDHVHPLTPREGTEVIARMKDHITGTRRVLPNGGSVTVLGFRPRDDQSMSLGYETRYWFDILDRLGAYPPSGQFPGVNDNPDYLSRNGAYLFCQFPNGAVAVAPHFTALEEGWTGGFARKAEEDAAIMKNLALPTEHIALEKALVAGHAISFAGDHAMTFRVDAGGQLIAFCGVNADRVTIDDKATIFADQPMPLAAWAPVEEPRRVVNGAVLELFFNGTGAVHIPVPGQPASLEVVTQGPTLGSRGASIPATREGDVLTFTLTPETTNRWLYVCGGAAK